MSPFDAARYSRLLGGLEASEIRLSALENEMTIGSEYYGPMYLEPMARLSNSAFKLAPLSQLCSLITDGDHGSADYADEGVRFVLSEAVAGGWVEPSKCRFITQRHAETLKRSTLKSGDVLVTKTGVYFGKSAVVEAWLAGANTIAHVGILRLRSDASVRPYLLSTFLNSAYGHAQLRRRGIKATRPEIKLLEFDAIRVPLMSRGFQLVVESVVLRAFNTNNESARAMADAESVLLAAIGLDRWRPPEPLSYVRRSNEAFNAHRLDAQFFAPRVQALLTLLGRDGLTVASVAPPRHQEFDPDSAGPTFQYIEIGDVGPDATVGSTERATVEAPSRATQHVKAGDVVTSTVRPIRRLSAIVDASQDGAVCSSGFVVLNPTAISGATLVTYLRLPLVCELMDLHCSASLYPAISERDLLGLPIPRIEQDVQRKVDTLVESGRAYKVSAAQLLDAAKRAVEIAIEDSEAAAAKYLEAFR
jgi:type I restriction enzyme, S subunit